MLTISLIKMDNLIIMTLTKLQTGGEIIMMLLAYIHGTHIEDHHQPVPQGSYVLGQQILQMKEQHFQTMAGVLISMHQEDIFKVLG